MSRKIYLEGSIGHKFGHSHSFTGESVKDALRCIETNQPEIRQYLIECHHAGVDFSVEVAGRELDDARELLLPLREGDIVITALPAGAKSGGAKILAAIALAALIIINPTVLGMNFMGGLGHAAVPGLTTLGQATAALAINLALAGVQQLMAPDPATDMNSPEGYLLNGSEQNVVEGDPIPILYGELRVPGWPVSFEVVNKGAYSSIAHINTDIDNNGNLNSYTGNYNTDSYLFGGEEYETYANSVSSSTSGTNTFGRASKSQTIYITDIISEGPIYGLVEGGSSVYLDDVRGVESSQSSVATSKTAVDFTFTAASTSVTIAKNGQDVNLTTYSGGETYLIVRDYSSTTGATASLEPIAGNTLGIKVTTPGAFFTATMERYLKNLPSSVIVRLVKNGITYFEGYVHKYTSTTVVTLAPLSPTSIDPDYVDAADYDVVLDGKAEVASISADQTSLTLAVVWPGGNDTFKADLTSSTVEAISADADAYSSSNFDDFSVQFRNGSLIQPVFSSGQDGGIGAGVSIGAGGSFTPKALTGPIGADNIIEYQGTSVAGFGLSTTQVEQVDEISVSFDYAAMFNTENQDGDTHAAYAWYTVEIAYDYGTGFEPYNQTAEIKHTEKSNTPLSFQWKTSVLEENKPFKDFKIRITRLSETDVAYETFKGATPGGYSSISAGSVTNLGSKIKEYLSYPYTAMSKISVNTEKFQRVPVRTYHCRGMKVNVPSNYITREESSTGEASYKRNVTTGAITGTYQNWDGNFRSDLVYTNNPAWVFYDILVNNRYGLGTWLSTDEVDKYSLYRIARYCDELVPDGNGGFEPRFTSNIYLRKLTDAYKVLKDMATIFRGMLYWIDGEMVAVPDVPRDPVYNFSKGNVADGAFNYESTGSKTRANQVVVTWTNPDANYRQEPLIIEDRANLVETGRVIKQDAVAYGATTEGQALRYGRWKLWTAKNQTELVSFKTAINAAFLAPGDVVTVQDATRNPITVQYSGRVSKTGTLSTTVIPLDRGVTLNGGSTYELSILLDTSGVFLSQTTATISAVVYNAGDQIPGAYTEATASDIIDDSGDPVVTTWQKYTMVENRPVTTTAGADISSLTVSPAFSTAPASETVWALREIDTATAKEVLGSKKDYKILAINEESKELYSITAVEHYNEKFQDVDEDFTLSVEDPLYPIARVTDIVPAPENIYVKIENLDGGDFPNDVTITWDAPKNSDGSLYADVNRYEIFHNIPEATNPVIRYDTKRRIKGMNAPEGTYQISIRTVNSANQVSTRTFTTFTVAEKTQEVVTRVRGMPYGGISSTPLYITDTTNLVKFEDPTYVFAPAGAPTEFLPLTSGATATFTQDVSTIASVNFGALTGAWAKGVASHWIMMDYSDAADPMKLVKLEEDATLGVDYWYDAGTGNGTPASNFTSRTGTVDVAVTSNTVIGTGTLFTTEYEVGDIIKFSGTEAARIQSITSATKLTIDRSFSTAITAAAATGSDFRIDPNYDSVIARVRNDLGTFEVKPINLIINPDLDNGARIVTLTATPLLLNFDGAATPLLTTTYTNLVLRATAQGFTSPEFKITGAGFSNSEISQVAETAWSAPTASNYYEISLDKVSTFVTTDLDFVVDVREAQDPTNTAKQVADTLTVPFIKDGLEGVVGTDGLRATEGYVYYQLAVATADPAPDAPGTAVSPLFTWATGVISPLATNWGNQPPLMAPGTDGKYYYAKYYVEQTTSADLTNTPTFGTVTLGTNFSGLVTFSAGDFELNGAPITTIDGGNITTNTITLDTLQSGTRYDQSGAGLEHRFSLTNSDDDIILGTAGPSQTKIHATAYFYSNHAWTDEYSNDGLCSTVIAENGTDSAAAITGISRAGACFFGYYEPTGAYGGAGAKKVLMGGDAYAYKAFIGSGTGDNDTFSVTWSGDVYAAGNITAFSSSDIRLKENVYTLENSLDRICALRPVNFTWKEKAFKEGEDTGFIAQELATVLPGAVREGGDGYLGIEPDKLIPELVGAIQELQKQIEELKNDRT